MVATVDDAMPRANGSLEVADGDATLRLEGMPQLRAGRIYQAWIQQGERMVPARTFEVGGDGIGEVSLPDVGDADGVYVTREASGGAQVPSEDPIVSVPLAFAGIAIGIVLSRSSPRYVRKSTFSGTVRPARGRVSSTQTRSTVAVSGSSVDLTVSSRLSMSTFS